MMESLGGQKCLSVCLSVMFGGGAAEGDGEGGQEGGGISMIRMDILFLSNAGSPS